MALPRLAASLLLLLAGACGVLDPDEEDVVTLFVGPSTVDCVGMGPRTCLLVKEREEDEWGYFYDAIEGFAYQPGYLYELRVLRREVDDPPADGSSVEWELIEVVSREPA